MNNCHFLKALDLDCIADVYHTVLSMLRKIIVNHLSAVGKRAITIHYLSRPKLIVNTVSALILKRIRSHYQSYCKSADYKCQQ